MPSNRSALAALFFLIALGGALVVLAVLQYRSIERLAEAERQQMQASLDFAARHFADEFDRELTRLFVNFQLPPQQTTADSALRRYDEFQETAHSPDLVRAIWYFQDGQLQSLDLANHTSMAVDWPPELARAREIIARGSRRPDQVVLPAESLLLVPSGHRPPGRRPGPPPPRDRDREPREFRGGEPPPPPRDEPPPEDDRAPALVYTIVQLDHDFVVRGVLPELTRRYFESGGTRAYDVEIARDDGSAVLYRSDEGRDPFRADMSMPIYRILEFGGGRPVPQQKEKWVLNVRHRQGTLESIVAATRRRNLLTSGGVLLVLAGSAIALVLMLRRAETLRRQQLEFVAGVTHELNTPIAALQSAGQNLADGVTHEPAQVERYGAMILKESRRLGDMVGQVLEYAGMQSGRARKPSSAIDVAEVVDDAVAHTRWICDQENVNVDVQIASDLPPVMGDAPSLSRAIQNLIGNAVKYGGKAKRIGVHARRNGGGVIIGVDDAGPGVAPEDAHRVFEPFYRGRGSDRARGSGLGLAIVKRIVDEHGGRIDIGRSPAGGASFTITLPEGRRG